MLLNKNKRKRCGLGCIFAKYMTVRNTKPMKKEVKEPKK